MFQKPNHLPFLLSNIYQHVDEDAAKLLAALLVLLLTNNISYANKTYFEF